MVFFSFVDNRDSVRILPVRYIYIYSLWCASSLGQFLGAYCSHWAGTDSIGSRKI